MKSVKVILGLVAVMAFSLGVFAQERNYNDGSVWQVSMVKTGANMSETYLISLKDTWKKMHDEALKQGIILSYKILSSSAANPDDYDILLLVEYKNLASMESSVDKWDAIAKSLAGGLEGMKKLNESRINMRTIYGQKLFREIIYK